jgi:hypothetical protein
MKSLLDITTAIKAIRFTPETISKQFDEESNCLCSRLDIAVRDLDDTNLEEELNAIREDIELQVQTAITAVESNNQIAFNEAISALKRTDISIARAYDTLVIQPSLTEIDDAISSFTDAQDTVNSLINDLENAFSEVGISSDLDISGISELEDAISDLEEARSYFEDDLQDIVVENTKAFISLVALADSQAQQFFAQTNQPKQTEGQSQQEEGQASDQDELDDFKVLELIFRLVSDASFAQKCFELSKNTQTQEEN